MVEAHEDHMRKALDAARLGIGRTSPNPVVGAVVVAGSEVVGRGWYRGPGSVHAERAAIEAAGDSARNSTLYVTLEPCAHQGGTPPCVDAIMGAGVARVVAAMQDPDVRVAGSGFRSLRERGIEVIVGIGEDRARRLNRPYLTHRTLGRTHVTLKAAMTLDGRVAAADGSSRWITGPDARRDVHRERARADAVCVGVGTVLADDPSLTARGVRVFRQPVRVVVDSSARTPASSAVLDGEVPTIVAVSSEDDRTRALESRGVEVLSLGGEGGRVSLPLLLKSLGERDIISMLLEGGPTLAAGFVGEGLVDRFLLYVAPRLMGSPGTPGLLEGWVAEEISQARGLVVEDVRRVGEDLRIDAYPESS